MISSITTERYPIHLWTDLDTLEDSARQQLVNVANLPWIHKHVAVMPDVHTGYGATVGSVIAMKDAVSPNAVGVDIGCGMAAIQTSLYASDLPDDLGKIRSTVEAAIPVGFSLHQDPVSFPDRYAGIDAPLMREIDDLHPTVKKDADRIARQVGSLGGGNHFIELCLDTHERVWLMLHSGSRGIGKQIADAHVKIAKTLPHNAELADPELAVLLAGTEQMQAYRRDLDWAQRYAMNNRATMLRLYMDALRKHLPGIRNTQQINCHHNYVAEERHFGADVLVTRKGAISARLGEFGIIPGSMGTRSYIVSGLGNPDSFQSASHGAGRVMSRGAARKRFTVADLEQQTAGVECRKDEAVIDEIPGAYKPIERVMAQQADLVTIKAELRQVMCVKG